MKGMARREEEEEYVRACKDYEKRIEGLRRGNRGLLVRIVWTC